MRGSEKKDEMKLKLYVDRMSQPSRAILIFCKANGIDFEEVKIDLAKGHHRSSEYAAINPMKQVPALVVNDDFQLVESHAILHFLVEAFPQVAEHWFPKDLFKRAQINSILDWHHSNLRRGSVGLLLWSTLAPAFGLPLNPQLADEGEKLYSRSLAHIETFWLKGDGPFLLGGSQPSIADLSLVCEIMQIEVAEDTIRERVLSPHKKVLKWIDETKKATQPHFDEIHTYLFQAKEMIQKKRSDGDSGESKAS